MAETEAVTQAPAAQTDAKSIVEYIDNELEKIKGREKKSNYHNARASAFTQVRNLIEPPAPKPPKEKKVKAKAAVAGTDAQTGEATDGVEGVDSPAAGDTGAA